MRRSLKFRTGAALLLAFVFAVACTPDEPTTADGALRVGYVAPAGAPAEAALRGAALGAQEAVRAGELVGRRFALLTARAASTQAAVDAAQEMVEQGAAAIVGGFDEPTCRALSQLAERRRVLFLNVGCRSDALRQGANPHTFHVEASEAMYRSAAAEEGGSAVIWHPDLARYGAAQLNDRFKRRFGTPPGAEEWASWMAIKLLWDATLRAESTDPRRLAALLEGNHGFDGHKGQPLTFGSRDHQLRQPLYLASSGRPAGGAEEAPGTVAAEGTPPGEGQLALISNEGSRSVSIINTATRRVVSTIPVGARPRGIHVSPDRTRAYVALSDDAPTVEGDDDAIAVIDIRRAKVISRQPAGTDPEQFAVSPDGTRLYAANEDAGTASVVDLRNNRVLATLVVGIEPEGVAVSPDGRWVYVTAETSNTVSVIDTKKNEVVASFLVDVRPRAAAFSPDGSRAYVTNEISGTVSVVDTRVHQVVDVVDLGAGRAKPVGVVVSPDGRRVYVANGSANTVSVIDAATNRVVATIPVGRRVWGLDLTPNGRWLYTANGGSDDVSVVDTATNQVVATIKVGERPWGVAITP